jgi:hypothetical protein
MRRLIITAMIVAVCWFAAYVARAADIQTPQNPVAGSEVTLPVAAKGTLYLFGPGTAVKKDVNAGDPLKVTLKSAGKYTAILNGSATTFTVVPGQPKEIAFLARPSRVPAARKEVISGTVFLFDRDHNLVLAPNAVKFELSVAGGATQTRTVQSKNGTAFTQMDSGQKAGAVQFVATVGSDSVRRVVQQTASDPCNLRMRVQQEKDGLIAETDPIRDCSGNPVPDGTIVTFTAVDKNGRSTVDARIKKGVARAQLPAMQNATVSVAAGVVMGNEVRVGGGM